MPLGGSPVSRHQTNDTVALVLRYTFRTALSHCRSGLSHASSLLWGVSTSPCIWITDGAPSSHRTGRGDTDAVSPKFFPLSLHRTWTNSLSPTVAWPPGRRTSSTVLPFRTGPCLCYFSLPALEPVVHLDQLDSPRSPCKGRPEQTVFT